MMKPEDITQILGDVRDIKRALIGDKEYGQPGLIKDVKSLKEWQSGVKLKVAFYSGAWTTLIVVADKILEHLHK